ncbi:MAG: YbhB/YbcL family Raf kinase inhibitor-like protein [Calditrichota bacterium]
MNFSSANLFSFLIAIVTAAGCGGNQGGDSQNISKSPGKAGSKVLEITSSAFENGGLIPVVYTCDGEDVSPPLNWGDPPPGTAVFALVCDDPDAPVGVWTHWLIYNIPRASRGLPEELAPELEQADGTRQGRNDFNRIGYGGPCPPSGQAHRYYFKLYALSSPLDLPGGASRAHILSAMEGLVLAEGQLMGKFGR